MPSGRARHVPMSTPHTSGNNMKESKKNVMSWLVVSSTESRVFSLSLSHDNEFR